VLGGLLSGLLHWRWVFPGQRAEDVLRLAPATAGLLFPPFNLAVVAGSLAGPRVIAAIGERRAMVAGLLAVAAGAMALCAIAPGAPALPSLLSGLLLLGAGLAVLAAARRRSPRVMDAPTGEPAVR
jgi:fucose permease